jgi:predicted transposase/invertase (TIGR01784 family)
MTNWEDLTITDDFLFGKVMRNKKLCKRMLEVILDMEIDHIEYPEEQKVIDMIKEAKSVRLDIYVKDDELTVYNVEMQTGNRDYLPKRSRYYQGMIDLELIEKGTMYKELNKSFVIFICTFDLFGYNRCVYTFENICKEDSHIVLGDETTKIFLNSTGDMTGAHEDLKAFLDYINTKHVSNNAFVRALDDEVHKAIENKEWRREYMTLYMRDLENIEKGREEGREEERRESIKALIEICQELSASKENTIMKLMEKYHLKKEEAKQLVEQHWKN